MKKTKLVHASSLEVANKLIEQYEKDGFEVVAPIQKGERFSFYITFQREEKVGQKAEQYKAKKMKSINYYSISCGGERPPRD